MNVEEGDVEEGGIGEVRDHGGSLARAAALFPGAPTPWIDCSTGINPHVYPLSGISASALADTLRRLPESADIAWLCETAARAYGAPGASNVVAAPGTQSLLPEVAALVRPGLARVLGPTYAEHRRCAALAGHRVEEVSDIDRLRDADLAVLVNPNNPDGRLHSRETLLGLAAALAARGGLLVVDEAFMDVAPEGFGLAAFVEAAGNVVILRSFGKFFGLAGLRLGFALASKALAARLRARLGPWAVSGPAVLIGTAALGDREWQAAERERLAGQAARLDAVFASHHVAVSGGTGLYRFLRTPHAPAIFESLGRQGVYVRRFDAMPDALRIGLPPDEAAWSRLSGALAGWRAGAADRP